MTFNPPNTPPPSPGPPGQWAALKPTPLSITALVGLAAVLIIAVAWPMVTSLALSGAVPPSFIGALSFVRLIMVGLLYIGVTLLGMFAFIRSGRRDVIGFGAASIGAFGLIMIVIDLVVNLARAFAYF